MNDEIDDGLDVVMDDGINDEMDDRMHDVIGDGINDEIYLLDVKRFMLNE